MGFSDRQRQYGDSRRDTSQQYIADIKSFVEGVVEVMGGFSGSGGAVLNRDEVVLWAATIIDGTFYLNSTSHLKNVNDSCRYILALYTKKRLAQIKDAIQASHFPDCIACDQKQAMRASQFSEAQVDALAFYNRIEVKNLRELYSESAQPSMADSAVDLYKLVCDQFTVLLDDMIDRDLGHLKGKTPSQMAIQLDPVLSAFIFDDHSGSAPAPRSLG